jgi:hypothetical protein
VGVDRALCKGVVIWQDLGALRATSAARASSHLQGAAFGLAGVSGMQPCQFDPLLGGLAGPMGGHSMGSSFATEAVHISGGAQPAMYLAAGFNLAAAGAAQGAGALPALAPPAARCRLALCALAGCPTRAHPGRSCSCA